MMKARVNKLTVRILQADHHTLDTEGVVLTTDPNLSLDPQVAQWAGSQIAEQLRLLNWADVGDAVVTDAPPQAVPQRLIHGVAPRWGEYRAKGKLAQLTWRCLEIAEDEGLTSLALPPISVGALGYPVENCAKVMLEQIIDFSFEKPKALKQVVLYLDPNTEAYQVFSAELRRQLNDLQASGEGQVRV